mgnify:CR=1 FL=1|jgi:hypothetical protein
MASGPIDMPRMVRVMRHPGLWEELMECQQCMGQGVCEIEYAVPDYRTGSGFIDTRHGECPVCEGRGYVEADDDDPH